MAGVEDQDISKVVIKKEVEDAVESPDNTEVQDSSQSTPDANGSSKNTKVLWSEDETRSMIELHKNYMQRFKEGNYSKKQLLEDVTQELNLIGYDITPEKVRNKMKYLRARYKGVMSYNARHVAKKIMPFEDELSELYNMEYFDDQEPLLPNEVNGNGDVSFEPSSSVKTNKRAKLTPAPHVDLKTVVTKKKRVVSRASKIMKKKRAVKRSGAPLFQCGLCMEKFRTSGDMHDHRCKTPAKPTILVKKKSPVNSASHLLTLWLKPTGNAPILKNKKWTVEKKQTIAMIMGFLKKYMNLESSASMFLYVNQSFAPSPDIEVGNIYDCFNINGKLVLHYSTSPAWG